jgi:hypothetical protein
MTNLNDINPSDGDIKETEMDMKSLPIPSEYAERRGKGLVTGNGSPSFTQFMEKYGLDKAAWLKDADKQSKGFIDNLHKRALAMQVLRQESAAILEMWNSTDARGLTVYEDLVKLSLDIQTRLNRKREEMGDEYDPLEDKVLQSALKRKNEMIITLERMKIDVRRLINDEKASRDGGKSAERVIDADSATAEDLDIENKI